ncbi:MAG: hypothetical protein SangKO_088780 [Sandaracinaceae bacterium]|nr:MAG: glyoxalase [Sandaracinaceae bacterium]
MSIHRVFASVFTDDLEASRRFWVELLGFTVSFQSNWFVHLAAPDEAALELGLLLRSHETIPKPYRDVPRGGLITVVVDDVDVLHERAQARGVRVVEAPRDMFYGQRRMLLEDPAGQLVDVSAPMPEATIPEL